ncbi:MAG TPA: elongation factor P--(R)-beta-lysine ligase [Gammaproteobacteria bacterium]
MNAVGLFHQTTEPFGDDWQASATIDHLKIRARLLRDIRAFFEARGVLEVETPVLSQATTPDPHLHSMTTRYSGPGFPAGKDLFLQTSPESAMKRLLACGSGSIYQICKAFRNDEAGRLHNPEFTLLEWYRTGYNDRMLMDEVEELVSTMLGIKPGFRRLTYHEAFEQHTGINPHVAAVELMQRYAAQSSIAMADGILDRDGWLDLIMTHIIEPQLGKGQPTFIYDYPASKAALASVRDGCPAVAERFELYVEGIELANGFHELRDPRQQGMRFKQDREKRRKMNLADIPPDMRLLAALESGLPPCAGVALGVDRLLMVLLKAGSVGEVMAFRVDRA